MRRRDFLLAGASLVWGSAAHGQGAKRIHRVGVIFGADAGSHDVRRRLSAFRGGMSEYGYKEGITYLLAVRYYGSDRTKIPALADELIAWKADVLVANISSTALVLKQKTATIPIVMATAVDAVAEGLVVSLARPGGNVTGMTSLGFGIHAKLIEVTRDLLPQAKRIVLVVNPDHPMSKSYEAAALEAARSLGFEMTTQRVRGRVDLAAFAQGLTEAKAEALVVATDGTLFTLREAITSAALQARLPTVALLPEFIDAGALATLGWDMDDNYRSVARYTDRILRGAKPAELPIEQPSRFQLALNLKAARSLGIAVPQALLARADRVIE